MIKDPIVEEIRKTREKHAAEFGYDARRIVAHIKKNQEQYKSRLVRRPPRIKLKATGS
jgi:hypothetical protein